MAFLLCLGGWGVGTECGNRLLFEDLYKDSSVILLHSRTFSNPTAVWEGNRVFSNVLAL